MNGEWAKWRATWKITEETPDISDARLLSVGADGGVLVGYWQLPDGSLWMSALDAGP